MDDDCVPKETARLGFLGGAISRTQRGLINVSMNTGDGGWVERPHPNRIPKKRAPEMITLENMMMFTYRITQFLIHTSHL